MSSTKNEWSDWQGTSLKVVKQESDERKSSGGEGSKVPNLKITEGTNKFRFFPAHPGTDDKNKYYQVNLISWLPYKKDDGTETRVPFKNARRHAGQAKDVIDEYRKLAIEIIKGDKSIDVKESADLIDTITDWKTGIAPKTGFLTYAKKKDGDNWERGILEITYGVQKKLDDLSLVDYEEDPDGIDIVSDPVEGYLITIKYDKKAATNDKYKVSNSVKDQLPLDAEDAAWIKEQKPLTELLYGEGVYHQGTFERAMKGLELYDEKHDIGVFNTDEFQEIAAELKAELPEAPARDEGSNSSDTKADKELEDMDRKELKQYILDNDLGIKVTRGMKDDEIIDLIVDALADRDDDEEEESDEPFDEGEEVDESEQEEKEEEEKPAARRERRSARRERAGRKK